VVAVAAAVVDQDSHDTVAAYAPDAKSTTPVHLKKIA
jgi:hypothetical protein